MKTVKEKLYNYEQTPPSQAWDNIHRQLTGGKVIPMHENRKRTRIIAFSTAAAAAVALLIINFIFVKRPEQSNSQQTVTTFSATPTDSMEENYELLESIIKAPENQKLLALHHAEEKNNLKYFTIEGPGGEPVKISPKVATLIVSADGEFPPKPVWDEKINEWQHIMLRNNVTPTSTNLLDIIQKASAAIE